MDCSFESIVIRCVCTGGTLHLQYFFLFLCLMCGRESTHLSKFSSFLSSVEGGLTTCVRPFRSARNGRYDFDQNIGHSPFHKVCAFSDCRGVLLYLRLPFRFCSSKKKRKKKKKTNHKNNTIKLKGTKKIKVILSFSPFIVIPSSLILFSAQRLRSCSCCCCPHKPTSSSPLMDLRFSLG